MKDTQFQSRFAQARDARAGENWKNRKTGAPVIVLERIGAFSFRLLHANGRKTYASDITLASNYEKISPP